MTFKGPVPRPTVMPATGTQQERIETAIGALETAVDEDAVFLWTGGKEAQVIADLLLYTIGGPDERSPVEWVTIDTGNHFDELVDFRTEYTRDRDIDVRSVRFDGLVSILQDTNDPREYHGKWNDNAGLPPTANDLDGVPRNPSGWDVTTSCGALKVVPIRRLIEEDGAKTLITGLRSTDPLTGGNLDVIEERREPALHTRVNPLADWSEANVYAYIKMESVPLCSLYTEDGYRHTDSVCCVDEDTISEYGEGGRDPQKLAQQERLRDMGYI